jgi:hypothetical protein
MQITGWIASGNTLAMTAAKDSRMHGECTAAVAFKAKSRFLSEKTWRGEKFLIT